MVEKVIFMSETPTIFISYSHLDETWKDLMVSHLKVAERQGAFEVWDDRRIKCGDDWRDEIDKALHCADIAVLFISRYYLTSNFIMDDEFEKILKRKQEDGHR